MKMSRSYRKTPVITDGALHSPQSKKMKRIFNRKFRRTKQDVANGNAYRKTNESWDISDYRFHVSWEEYQNWEWVRESDMTDEEKWADWCSTYRSK